MRCVMQRRRSGLWLLLVLLLSISSSLQAQQQAVPTTAAQTGVPRLIKFAGSATAAEGKALGGTVGISFAIYQDQQGGAPLWMETQNVTLDRSGHYTALLGATKPDGLPMDLFTSGEARWLGASMNGGEEQPRVLLLSVPYALQAADAQTLGGLPPSAFMLAAPLSSASNNAPTATTAAPGSAAPATNVTGSGTLNFLPLWTGTTAIGNSVLFQSGTGSAAKVGINTTTPGATLDVKGAANVQGLLTSPATGTATSAAGKSSQAYDLVASSFSSSTKAAVNQTFQWKAEATNNNTTTPSGTLNLLFGSGTASPTETGLKLSSKGLFTFATGQTFPGTGSGTVTSVALAAPASDFKVSGSPITGAGTLNLAWTVAPTGSNTANAIVKRDGSGNFAANTVTATTVNAVDVQASDAVIVNTTNFNAVVGFSSSTNATAVSALASATSGPARGVEGQTNSSDLSAMGVLGVANATSGDAIGVNGVSLSSTGLGVLGQGGSSSLSKTAQQERSFPTGILGDSSLSGSVGVLATADDGLALKALNNSNFTTLWAENFGVGDVLFADGTAGSVRIDTSGTVHASGGFVTGFALQSRMDHPLDPTGKYLTHASIESSEMLNLYTGNAILGADGSAAVPLPDWFTALNEDFRYQLTPIGGFAQLYIAEEITGSQFRIAGGRGGMKVSWQVTGVRRDAYAKMHPLVVESEKQGDERGHYLHPDAFGQPLEMGITAVRRAKLHAQRNAKPASAPVILKGLGVTKEVAR